MAGFLSLGFAGWGSFSLSVSVVFLSVCVLCLSVSDYQPLNFMILLSGTVTLSRLLSSTVSLPPPL